MACGGGGGSESSGSGGSGSKTIELGSVSLSVGALANEPVTIGTRNAVFTGIGGGNITAARLRLPPPNAIGWEQALAFTSIAFDKNGRASLLDLGSREDRILVPDLNSWGNSTQPSISGLGNKIATSEPEPGSTKWQIWTSNIDGTDRRMLTSASDWSTSPDFSPDGTKIVFQRFDVAASRYRIFSMAASGGSATPLSPATDNCQMPKWSPDGSKILFALQAGGVGNYLLYTIKPDGTDLLPVPGGLSVPSFISFDYLSNGRDIVFHFYDGGYRYGWINDAGSWGWETSADALGQISAAPVGDSYSYTRAGAIPGIYQTRPRTGVGSLLLGGSGMNSPSWGPYVQQRTILGPGGMFGANAGGFIFGQAGNLVTSMVTVDATTRSTILIKPQENPNPNQANGVCTVTGDLLKSLKYANSINGTPVVVLGGSLTAHGAVIYFNADTGIVTSVVPYNKASSTQATSQRRQGTQVTHMGRLLGVWDETGKNLAPSGASEVTVEETTGKVVSWR